METYVFHRESDKTFITRKTKLKIIFQVQDFFVVVTLFRVGFFICSLPYGS